MNGLNEATKFHSKSFNRNFFPSWKHFSSKEFIIEIKSATPNRISFYSIILSNTKRKVERKKNSFSFDQVRMIKKSPLQTLVSDDSQWAKGRYYSAAVAAAYRLVFVRARASARERKFSAGLWRSYKMKGTNVRTTDGRNETTDTITEAQTSPLFARK
jgi:hypothetical protein